MSVQAVYGRDRVETTAVPGVVFTAGKCGAGETLFMTIRMTRMGGGIRVDYQVAATGDARWANMNASLVRKYRIRAGATFCMPLDSGDAAESLVDFD